AASLAIYVAFRKRRNPGQALHWMIVTAPKGSTTSATYYHVAGGPTQNLPFLRQIAGGKRLSSNSISETFHIGTVPDKEKNKIKAASTSASLPRPGENCQSYVVDMIQRLEAKSLVGAGWVAHFQAQIERPKSPTPEAPTGDIVDGKENKDNKDDK
ncbi:hypothetical protein BJ878DRAFT_414384, partial [Calycina marina]